MSRPVQTASRRQEESTLRGHVTGLPFHRRRSRLGLHIDEVPVDYVVANPRLPPCRLSVACPDTITAKRPRYHRAVEIILQFTVPVLALWAGRHILL